MTTAAREKFSSQAAPDVLAALRHIAESQGRQFQAVLDDALRWAPSTTQDVRLTGLPYADVAHARTHRSPQRLA